MSSSVTYLKQSTCIPTSACAPCLSKEENRGVRGGEKNNSRWKTDEMKKETQSRSGGRQGVPQEEDLMKEWW